MNRISRMVGVKKGAQGAQAAKEEDPSSCRLLLVAFCRGGGKDTREMQVHAPLCLVVGIRGGGGSRSILICGVQSSTLGTPLPGLEFGVAAIQLALEFVACAAEFGNGLLREQLFQRPLFNVLAFILFQLLDKGHGTLENAAFVLFAAWHNLGNLVDAFIDGFTATTFDCFHTQKSAKRRACAAAEYTHPLCGCLCAPCAIRLFQQQACLRLGSCHQPGAIDRGRLMAFAAVEAADLVVATVPVVEWAL